MALLSRRSRAKARFLASCVVLLLAGSFAPAGIIELGKQGQKAGGSVFNVLVEGRTFNEGSHAIGDTVESIALKVRNNIDASPLYTATIPDPNNPTNITILRETGIEPFSLEVSISDPNIFGAFVDSGGTPATAGTFQGANAVSNNGNFEIDVTTFCPGMAPMTFTHVVSTLGGKTVAQVNAEMVALLRATGYAVTGPSAGNVYTLTVPSNQRLQKIEMTRTDTGITVSGVGATTQYQANVPTLSEWGLLLLTVLVAVAGALALRLGGHVS